MGSTGKLAAVRPGLHVGPALPLPALRTGRVVAQGPPPTTGRACASPQTRRKPEAGQARAEKGAPWVGGVGLSEEEGAREGC